jgi:hypothetical protein
LPNKKYHCCAKTNNPIKKYNNYFKTSINLIILSILTDDERKYKLLQIQKYRSREKKKKKKRKKLQLLIRQQEREAEKKRNKEVRHQYYKKHTK